MNAKPLLYDSKQAAELLGTFFGMVMTMCKQLGMDEKDAIELFSPKHIKGGYALLDKKAKP
jgi:hypothetical protein